ncbi:MAG: hypothetical protein AXA67_05915 [Methylothermaceae bacteria B42]|nr:MAG: hypothetical protein AXA67_05915 [Methylothermaceae bacteria B42]
MIFTLRLFFLLILLANPVFAAAKNHSQRPHYRWGRGLYLPAQKILLGGYFNFTFKALQGRRKQAELDDLSLFFTWAPHPRLRLFSELELEDLFTIDSRSLHSNERFFSVERLYLDYFITGSWRLRLGKFLTPVGRWNVIHASPLVWTTSRPSVTEHFFAPHASGAMLSTTYTLKGRDLDIDLYFDASNALDPKKTMVTFKTAFGLRLNYEFSPQLQMGASFLHFKMERPSFQPAADLFGLDMFWNWHRFEISSEFAYRRPESGRRGETGLYLQGAIPLGHRIFAVGRYEYLQGTHLLESGRQQGTAHIGIGGLAWRPATPLVFKVEYRFGRGNRRLAPDGFLMSVAMLF